MSADPRDVPRETSRFDKFPADYNRNLEAGSMSDCRWCGFPLVIDEFTGTGRYRYCDTEDCTHRYEMLLCHPDGSRSIVGRHR